MSSNTTANDSAKATTTAAAANTSRWEERATRFREQLSFLSTTNTHSDSQRDNHLKSRWSPGTTVHSANSRSTSPTIASDSPVPVPPLPNTYTTHSNRNIESSPEPEIELEMPKAEPQPPIPLTMWHTNRSHTNTLVESDRGVAGPSRTHHDDSGERDVEAGPSSYARPSLFARLSMWRARKVSGESGHGVDLPPETPASAASSFIPNKLATWRPLNILRPSRPPVLLPTSSLPLHATSTTHLNTTEVHHHHHHDEHVHDGMKPMHLHTTLNMPKQKLSKEKKSEKVVKKENKNRKWIILLIIIILYLIGNNIFLNVKVSSLSQTVSSSSSSSTGSGSTKGESQAVKDCLSQFKLNAPSNPSSFPCSTCVPVLSAIPNDFSSSSSSTTGQGSILQFCALRDIVSATSNSSTLPAVGWMRDNDPCGSWSGISCDTKGRVTSLELVFPGVPATMPASLPGALVALQTLKITGNGQVPSGTILASSGNVSSILAIPSLQNILLHSTALAGPLPDSTFSALSNLSSIQLVNNPQLGTSLPSSVLGLGGLKSLVVNGQGLTSIGLDNASDALKKSLTTLDLSSNALSGTLPDLSSFSSLVELNLGSNSFSSLPPTSSGDDGFPQALQTLNLANNTALGGTLPGALCASGVLSGCDVRNTGLDGTGGCGGCLFGGL